MFFTLEALQAKEGDSLLLHYGKPNAPRLVVIDGGPSDTYADFLRPRLDEIRSRRADPQQALQIRMLMVSHIDDDHIVGVNDLVGDLAERNERPPEVPGQPAVPYNILTLWFNSFNDVVGDSEDELRAMSAKIAGGSADAQALSEALPVTVDSGRRLRDQIPPLHITLNEGFPPKPRLVVAPAEGKKQVPLGGGLTFTVVGPNEKRLAKLQKTWDKFVEDLDAADTDAARAQVADAIALTTRKVDTSPYNLSSIVVLAEFGGKRMLLTGDGLGKDILDGLETAGLLESGKIHLDLLKLPHHGSANNVSPEFFQAVTADHYVISADGKHENPSMETLQWLVESRAGDDATFRIYLTNDDSAEKPPKAAAHMKKVVRFLREEPGNGTRYEVVFRERDARSVKVDLLDPVEF